MFGPKEPAGWRTLGLLTWGEVEWDWERPQGLVKSTQAPVGPLSEASWAGQQCTDCVLLGLISLLGNSGVGEINYRLALETSGCKVPPGSQLGPPVLKKDLDLLEPVQRRQQ